jgi:hypothetical protein
LPWNVGTPFYEAKTMNAEAIREFLRAQPFQPFEVRLSNGDVHRVRHPEFGMLLKNVLIVGYPDSDRAAFCSLLHIAGIERVPSEQPT